AGSHFSRKALIMVTSKALPAVLARIDADLEKSLERLFDFLIESISTDPAYSQQCFQAAQFVADDLAGIGFATSIRPTAGHPIVIGKPQGSETGIGAHSVLFYGHYDVQTVGTLDNW